MRQKKFLGFLLLFVPFISFGAYPESLNNGKPFSSVSDFENLYQEVYQDTNRYKIREIKKRVCEYADIECEKTLDLENFEDIVNSVRAKISDEKLSQERFRILIENRIEFEAELIKQEEDLDRKNSLSLLYSDGDGLENDTYTKKNSPFDITKSLNILDELFFGEKKNHFFPEFIRRPSKQNKNEPWLNQSEENLPEPSLYEESDPSFSGILEHLGFLFGKNVNPFSLICTVNTKNIFQYPFCTAPIGTPIVSVETFSPPQAPTDTPESESIQEEYFGETFTPTLLKVLKSSECESQDIREESEKNTTQTSGLNQIEACKRNRYQDLQNQKSAFEKKSHFDDIRNEYNGIRKSLEFYDGILEFFIDYSEKVINRFKSINTHSKG